MRDIQRYEEDYKNHSFEEVMVLYRRKVVLNELAKYKVKEIICWKLDASKILFSNIQKIANLRKKETTLGV